MSVTISALTFRAGSSASTRLFLYLLVMMGLFLALIVSAGIHYLGSDDVTYWAGGQGWLQHFPYIGGHGTDRETIVLPLAAASRLLGNNIFALVLPTVLYSSGLIILLALWCKEVGGLE